MKKFYFLLMLMIVSAISWSQTKNWIGTNGASWQADGSWAPAGVPDATSDVVINSGSALGIINVPSVTIRRLIISGGTITLSAAGGNQTLIVGGGTGNDFTIANGATLIQANNFEFLELANGTTADISGTYVVNGTFDADGNPGTRPVTTVSSTGLVQNNGAITSTSPNRLSFANGATYIHLRDGGSLPEATWDNNSNCNITGIINTMPTVGTFNQDFGNFTWDCQNQLPFTPPSVPSLAGELQNIDGDFTINSTGTGSLYLANATNFTTAVTGDYIQTGGTLVIINSSGNGTLDLMGNFNMSGGTLSRNGGTSNFVFDRNGLQTFTKTGGTISGAVNFRIDNNSIVDFGTSILNGSAATFTLDNDGKIITAHPDGLRSSGTIGSIQVGGTRTYGNDADYEFRGGSTGTFSTGGGQVRDLIINNTSGQVMADRIFVVNGALTLTNGYLTTDAGEVTVSTSGSSTTANGSFVNGPLAKVINSNNTSFSFYVGTATGGLGTIGATTATGGTSTTFTARFFDSNPKTVYAGATVPGTIEKISACEYWTLDRTGTRNARVTLSWSAATCGGSAYVTQPASLRVLRHNGGTPGAWTDAGYSGSTPSTVTSADVTSFSPFTIGTTNAAANPLPVVFANVKAYEKSAGVQIEWSNLTEKDVADYTIERSVNGKDFTSIGKQLPTSNQNDKADYNAFDAAPNAGANYYRIKAVETTGKIVYSKVLSVNLGNTAQRLKVYPNPVKDNQVNISLSNLRKGQYDLRVINSAGQDVFKQRISSQGSTITQTIDLPSSVKPGVYNMVITGGDYRETKMFIVQ